MLQVAKPIPRGATIPRHCASATHDAPSATISSGRCFQQGLDIAVASDAIATMASTMAATDILPSVKFFDDRQRCPPTRERKESRYDGVPPQLPRRDCHGHRAHGTTAWQPYGRRPTEVHPSRPRRISQMIGARPDAALCELRQDRKFSHRRQKPPRVLTCRSPMDEPMHGSIDERGGLGSLHGRQRGRARRAT